MKCVCAIALLIVPQICFAQNGVANANKASSRKTQPLASPTSQIDWSYLYTDGAVPFFWLPLAYRFALGNIEPPSTPILFSPNAGGKSQRGDTVPSWTLAAGTIGVLGGMALSKSDAKWFHIKGLGQSMAVKIAIVSTMKNFFGRRRPDFDEDNPTAESRRSFPSGHASTTLALTTYTALFLRNHGFKKLRGDKKLPLWEAATYAGLLGLSVYVPVSRVTDHRHNTSDVIVGAAMGAAISTAFYAWQESRYRNATNRESMPRTNVGITSSSQVPIQLAISGQF